MPDILHRVGAKAARRDVYKALTTVDGVASWWTNDASGDTAEGGVIQFGFEPGEAVAANATFQIKVQKTIPDELVSWEVLQGASGVDRHGDSLRAQGRRRLRHRQVRPPRLA